MTRENLKTYKYSQKWINEQLQRYEEQRTMVMNISQKLDGMPKAQNKTSYALEELIDQYNELINILKQDQQKQNDIIKQLRLVDEPYRTILTSKYISDKSLEQIAVDVGYAYENVCRMHGIALNKFDELDKVVSKYQDISV